MESEERKKEESNKEEHSMRASQFLKLAQIRYKRRIVDIALFVSYMSRSSNIMIYITEPSIISS